jgi:hypothetical protein
MGEPEHKCDDEISKQIKYDELDNHNDSQSNQNNPHSSTVNFQLRDDSFNMDEILMNNSYEGWKESRSMSKSMSANDIHEQSDDLNYKNELDDLQYKQKNNDEKIVGGKCFKYSTSFKEKLEKSSSQVWKGLSATTSFHDGNGSRAKYISSDEKAKLVGKYRRFTPAIMHRQLTSVL